MLKCPSSKCEKYNHTLQQVILAVPPKVRLLHGDCLELMITIKPKTVAFVLCDLPYGVTAPSWDIQIVPKSVDIYPTRFSFGVSRTIGS
jgi:hypothetical protein